MISKRRLILSAGFLMAAGPAWAHAGHGPTSDFASGFIHPLQGLDHVLAMATVGLFAATLGGRALWAVPASFVAMMLVGGTLGMMGLDIPALETGILASIVVLGSVVALGRSWSAVSAMVLVGVFAVFHGYAHGAEMPFEAGAVSYSLGFAFATALLHGAGLFAGTVAFGSPAITRFAGAAVAAAGIVLALS